MKEDIKNLWVDALHSGEYKQGFGQLNKEGSFCCLGVLCDLAVIAGVEVEVKPTDDGRVSYDFEDSQLPEAVLLWAGFRTASGNVAIPPLMIDNSFTYSLAQVNDTQAATFDDIAMIIEGFWEEL